MRILIKYLYGNYTPNENFARYYRNKPISVAVSVQVGGEPFGDIFKGQNLGL